MIIQEPDQLRGGAAVSVASIPRKVQETHPAFGQGRAVGISVVEC